MKCPSGLTSRRNVSLITQATQALHPTTPTSCRLRGSQRKMRTKGFPRRAVRYMHARFCVVTSTDSVKLLTGPNVTERRLTLRNACASVRHSVVNGREKPLKTTFVDRLYFKREYSD